MPPNAQSALVADFTRAHGEHYDLGTLLGEGGSGFVHCARDKRRAIDVCIKFYWNGEPPAGAGRDWRITSTLKHALLADTFTVEHFARTDGSTGVAVVSRLFAGTTLGSYVDGFRALDPALQADLLDDTLQGIAGDLLIAVRACHDAGHGHGDLSERNVIVVDRRVEHRRVPGAILIDFDNATYKPELRELTEGKLIEKDLHSLRRLIALITFQNSQWHEPLQELLSSARSARMMHRTFSLASETMLRARGEAPNAYSHKHWTDRLRTLLAASLAGDISASAFHAFADHVASDRGKQAELDQARKDLQRRALTDPSWPSVSMSMETRHVSLDSALDALFGKS